MHGHHKPIAVLYHGGCPDGFGGAYAAWKKFGDRADYIPARHTKPIPEGIEGKDIYMIDFCYNQAEKMQALAQKARSLVVLDHHEGVREVVESFPGHVYAEDHSGAVLAWNYFFPGTPVPTFLQYLEKSDLHQPMTPEEQAVVTYCCDAHPWHFDIWDEHVRRVEDPVERAKIVERGAVYREYFDLLIRHLAGSAELVEFEGYTCYLVGGARMFISPLGSYLVEKHPPIALVGRMGVDGLRISIRSDGSVDTSALARKYGGNGHRGSSAFSIRWGEPIPWRSVNP